ncbi:MAG: hypothetical protein AVDCRST_MAG27-2972, partial [uncultured Craurococcus sp.]
ERYPHDHLRRRHPRRQRDLRRRPADAGADRGGGKAGALRPARGAAGAASLAGHQPHRAAEAGGGADEGAAAGQPARGCRSGRLPLRL